MLVRIELPIHSLLISSYRPSIWLLLCSMENCCTTSCGGSGSLHDFLPCSRSRSRVTVLLNWEPRRTSSSKSQYSLSFFTLVDGHLVISDSFLPDVDRHHATQLCQKMAFLTTFLNTGLPFTGGNCRRSPTKRTLTEPNHVSPPNTSSRRRCMYARLRLDSMDTSLTISSFK